ncbi:HNH endonuclease [Gordonia otitidis]|uniref:HNH endonuclease n=1 Tax=Gordonia otitidis TaxID=249058 RepID=UPI001D136517|nr:HNH endonuclease [Gordonia otitidis]UEA60660.1 HNH endonuclease [Gordonia otitidis]
MAIRNDANDPVDLARHYGLWNSPRHFCWKHWIPEAESDDPGELAAYWVTLRKEANSGVVPRKAIKATRGVIAEKVGGHWIPRYYAVSVAGTSEATPITGRSVVFEGVECAGQARTYAAARRDNSWSNDKHSPDFGDVDCPAAVRDLDASGAEADGAEFADLERRYAERVVAQRLHQPELRRQTLAHYGTACAYCGLDVPQIIEAAHLIADSQGGAASVDNMRPMCLNHHRAYDAGLLVWDAAGGRFEPAPGAAQVAPLRAGSSAVQ